MTPATKKLIKLLVEQTIADLPEEPNPDEVEVLRDWMARIHKVLEEMGTRHKRTDNGEPNRLYYYNEQKAGEELMSALRTDLRWAKEKQNDPRAKQKAKQDARPYGRIPGVNDIPKPKKNKPEL